MKKFYIIIVFVLFAQLFFGLNDKIVKGLDLTDEQVEKIDKIIKDYNDKMEKLKVQIQIKQLDLKKLLLQEETKKELIKSALEDIGKLDVEIKYLRFSREIDIFNLLNDQQKEKYKLFRIKKSRDTEKNMKDDKSKPRK